MQAVDRELLSVLGDPTIRFVVPVYQRSYAWEREHWERLGRDGMMVSELIIRNYGNGQMNFVCIAGMGI